MKLQSLFTLIEQFHQARVLVVGDLMLDRYIWGKVSRISPEAPVPIVQVTREDATLGGAANVAMNLRQLGAQVKLVGLIGADPAAKEICERLEQAGVSSDQLVVSEHLPTIQKTRVIAHHQQVCRVDRESSLQLSARDRSALRAKMLSCLPRGGSVIISDYGKGVIDEELLAELRANKEDIFVSIDPKDKNFNFYHSFDILTPNHSEAERLSGLVIDQALDSVKRAASAIFQKLNCRQLLITLGENGMALFHNSNEMVAIPTQAREVFDVSGAGDTVIATYSLAMAAGATPVQAAVLANSAAGVVVAKLGTATLTADELKNALTNAAPVIQDILG